MNVTDDRQTDRQQTDGRQTDDDIAKNGNDDRNYFPTYSASKKIATPSPKTYCDISTCGEPV